jgi:putative flippase GtrA
MGAMRKLARQVLAFTVVGLLGTATYLALFVVLRGLGGQPASLLARLLVALPTSWVNARVTFGSRVAVHRAYAAGLAGLFVGAVLAAVTLLVLSRVDPHPTRVAELAALGATQLAAAAIRFAALRQVALTGAPQQSHQSHLAACSMVKEPQEDADRLLVTVGASMTSLLANPVLHLPRSADVALAPLELLLFSTDSVLVAEATAAGIDGFIVDWERRGKSRRQAGEGTQINEDTLEDLVRVRAATRRTVLCRIDGYGPWTAHQVERAIEAGADELLLPMVRNPQQVDRTLEHVAGRCSLGILIETQDGVQQAAQLARRPLSRVYVGLNDLRIDRGSASLFQPLVDGTVDEVRADVDPVPFGVAGLTLPDRGAPVPSRLLAAELVRLRASFTFLRRSFLADTAGRPLAPAVTQIRAALAQQAEVPLRQRRADRAALRSAVPADPPAFELSRRSVA